MGNSLTGTVSIIGFVETNVSICQGATGILIINVSPFNLWLIACEVFVLVLDLYRLMTLSEPAGKMVVKFTHMVSGTKAVLSDFKAAVLHMAHIFVVMEGCGARRGQTSIILKSLVRSYEQGSLRGERTCHFHFRSS